MSVKNRTPSVYTTRYKAKEKIMLEAYCTPYTAHSGAPKMYQDLGTNFWWEGIKNIDNFVQKCLKAKKLRPNIRNRRDYGCLYQSLNRSKVTSQWIFLQGFPIISGARCYMGSGGSTHQVCTLPTHLSGLLNGEAGTNLPSRDIWNTRSAGNNHLR